MRADLYEKLDDVFFYSPNPIRIIDLNYDTVSVNDAFISLAGISKNEIYSKKCYQSLNCSLCRTKQCPLEHITKGEFRFESETEIRLNNKPHLFYILTAIPLIGEEGDLDGIIEYYKDITYLKNIEKQVRKSEEKFRDIFENMINGIMTYQINEKKDDFILQDLNNSASFIEQLDKAEAVGRSFTDLFPSQAEHRLLETYLRVYKSGESELSQQYFYQDDRISGWREAFIFKSSTEQVVVIFEDITINKQNEEKNLKLISAIEHNPSSIVITDSSYNIEYVNPAFSQITGYAIKEVKGHDISVFSKQTLEEIREGTKEGQSFECEFIHQKKSGEDYYNKLSVAPIYNKKNEIINFVITHNDITEFKKLQSNLLHAQKMESVGQLSAGIAHEINTPIQYISDNLKFVSENLESIFTLLKRILKTEDLLGKAELLNKLNNSDLEFLATEIPLALKQSLDGANQIGSIIKAMKEFSHPGVRDMVNTDINKLIHTVLSITKNEWKYFCTIETKFDLDLPSVLVYANEINQVLLNLIVNSAQAIGELVEEKKMERGVITITTERDEQFVVISVADNGPGIPKEIQHKIYDPFFTTKSVGKGSGQGLYIAHDIITNKHKGKIELYSSKNDGTTFKLYLPII